MEKYCSKCNKKLGFMDIYKCKDGRFCKDCTHGLADAIRFNTELFTVAQVKALIELTKVGDPLIDDIKKIISERKKWMKEIEDCKKELKRLEKDYKSECDDINLEYKQETKSLDKQFQDLIKREGKAVNQRAYDNQAKLKNDVKTTRDTLLREAEQAYDNFRKTCTELLNEAILYLNNAEDRLEDLLHIIDKYAESLPKEESIDHNKNLHNVVMPEKKEKATPENISIHTNDSKKNGSIKKIIMLGIAAICIISILVIVRGSEEDTADLYMEDLENSYLIPEEFGRDVTTTEALAVLCGEEKYTFEENKNGTIAVTCDAMTMWLGEAVPVKLELTMDLDDDSVMPEAMYLDGEVMDIRHMEAFIYRCEGYDTLSEELLEQWENGVTGSYIEEMKELANQVQENVKDYDEELLADAFNDAYGENDISEETSSIDLNAWIGTFISDDGQKIQVTLADESGVTLTFTGYGEEGEYSTTEYLPYVNDEKTLVSNKYFYNDQIIEETQYSLNTDFIEVKVLPSGGWAEGIYGRMSEDQLASIASSPEIISGYYIDSNNETSISISIYSSPEDEVIGIIEYDYGFGCDSYLIVDDGLSIYQLLDFQANSCGLLWIIDNGIIAMEMYGEYKEYICVQAYIS